MLICPIKALSLCVPSRKLSLFIPRWCRSGAEREARRRGREKTKKKLFIEKDNLEERAEKKLIVFIMIIDITVIYTIRCYELEIIFRGMKGAKMLRVDAREMLSLTLSPASAVNSTQC
jgi:hypothetical protein